MSQGCPGRFGETVSHVYLNSVQQMVSGELAGECLQRGFERHGLPPQRALLDTVYPFREHLKQCPENGVRRMLRGLVSRHGLLDTVKKHMGFGTLLRHCRAFGPKCPRPSPWSIPSDSPIFGDTQARERNPNPI